MADAGDGLTEVAHERAKYSQDISEYSRERLRIPRFSYAEERRQSAKHDASVPKTPPFLELVLGGSTTLHDWYVNNRGHLHMDGQASLHRDPMELHCHTPLNQRLLPVNMRVCQTLVETLGLINSAPRPDVPPVLVAAICFVRLTKTMALSQRQQRELADFGASYLSRFLEHPRSQGAPGIVQRRSEQIQAAYASARITFPDRQGMPLAGSADDLGGGFFFPESAWMQFHWFTASLGVGLAQELALADALVAWSDRKAVRPKEHGQVR